MNELTTQDLTQHLQANNIRFTQLTLDIPEATTYEQWVDVGRRLHRIEQVTDWWLADWAAFGNTKWPGEESDEPQHKGALKRFAVALGYAEQTIYNAATVARKVPPSRRREQLSFGHHEAVASLGPKEQEKWLAEAQDKGMSRSELRTAVRTSKGKQIATEADGATIKWPQDKNVTGLVAWMRDQPADYWTDEVKDYWKRFLTPLVEIYQKL